MLKRAYNIAELQVEWATPHSYFTSFFFCFADHDGTHSPLKISRNFDVTYEGVGFLPAQCYLFWLKLFLQIQYT
jgi:hypothetical protein